MKRSGFTLIELMITVAIVGILAAIAYPSYQSYVATSSRAEAVAILLDVANRQEQYYLDHHGYASGMKVLGYGADPHKTENSLYSVAVKTDSSAGFIATATAQGAQASRDSDCKSLGINGLGTKLSNGNGTDTQGCWP